MPIIIEFVPERDLVRASHHGVVPDEEFRKAYTGLFSDERFKSCPNMLVDLSSTDSSVRTSGELEGFAAMAALRLSDSDRRHKIAVVAPKDISFGLARMCQAFTRSISWDFVVFRDSDAAETWLQSS